MKNKDLPHTRLNQVLTDLLTQTGVSLTQLSKNTGVPIPTIKRLQSDPDTNPTISNLLPIARFFDVSLNQLLGVDEVPEWTESDYLQNKQWTELPIYAWKDLVEATQNSKKKPVALGTIATEMRLSDAAFALSVAGYEDTLFVEGSILIVEPQFKAEHKDYVLVYKARASNVSLKQMYFEDGKRYLKSLRSGLPTVTLDHTYKILGVVAQVRYDFKAQSKESFKDDIQRT